MKAATSRTAAIAFQNVFTAGSADTSSRDAVRSPVTTKVTAATAATLKMAMIVSQKRSAAGALGRGTGHG